MGIFRLLAVVPGVDALGPTLEGWRGVTAGVEFFGTVQAQVDEVAGEVFTVRPFIGGVGDYQGGVVALQ